ncbi:hypothetical protein D3C74_288410 [compost metagenome]
MEPLPSIISLIGMEQGQKLKSTWDLYKFLNKIWLGERLLYEWHMRVIVNLSREKHRHSGILLKHSMKYVMLLKLI